MVQDIYSSSSPHLERAQILLPRWQQDLPIRAGTKTGSVRAGGRTYMSNEFRAFLQLLYSFCKQYISWYETQIKVKA
jgi:hypothetical protein